MSLPGANSERQSAITAFARGPSQDGSQTERLAPMIATDRTDEARPKPGSDGPSPWWHSIA